MSYSFSENQWGEKYIEELNRADFTSMKSSDFFDRALDYQLERENTLYVLIGSDSGLLLPYLKRQALGRGSRIAVIEHDDVYPMVFAEYRGLLANDDSVSTNGSTRITLHKHTQWREEVFDGSDKPWLLGGQITVIESNASATDYTHIYMPILRATKSSVHERIADISVTLNRSEFTKMQFRNAADNHTPLEISTNFGNGKTAIVLGAGPSLDQHLEWVIANKTRLFIIAVSRIASKLLKHELKPDLLVSVDPYDYSYEICKSGLIWTDVPLVHNFHVSAKLLQQWQGPSYFLGKRLPWHGKEQLDGFIASAGPTVSHAAVFVASQIGFSQILMTGVDMCFSASASAHTEDSPEQMIQKMPSLCDAKVETYSGKIAGTSAALKQYCDSLDSIGKLVNRHQPVLFNISEYAARLDSISYKSLEEVELPDEKPAIETHFNMNPCLPTISELDGQNIELKRARHVFTKIRTLCSEATTCVRRMNEPNAGSKSQQNAHKLSKIRKQLEKDYPDYLGAIIYDNGYAFSKASTPTDFNEMSADELIDWGSQYYILLDDGARNMIKYIDDVDTRITLRRDEHDIDIDVRQLGKRWREDETPGRIMLWKKIKWQNVKAEDRAWVQRAIGKFRSTLNEPSTKLKQSVREHSENINNIMRSLLFLAENEGADDLLAIESKLSPSVWPYSALKTFTAGLVFELDENPSAALTEFQRSIDICSELLEQDTESLDSMQRLIESCLARMTQCYMGQKDYESALTTLGMLCEMLPSYVVSYAKMLNLCGQNDYAIELLESYVELYPTHKKAQFVLSQLRPSITKEDPVYARKISGAMAAIMGGKPGEPA